MMRRLAWSMSAAVAVILIACSSDKGTTSGGFPDDAQADGAGTTDGSRTDSSAQDSATDSPTDAGADADGAVPGTFTLTSTAFADGANMPAVHTCNGTNVSPPLVWTNAPAGTMSYAVVMRDLTLVGANYHWVIYDIDAANTSLQQAVQSVAAPATPAGAKQTYWSFGANYSYRGPCPPSGVHDYQFTVYSFATATIPVPGGTTDPAAADAIIQANKTGSASLTGKYMQ